MIGVSSKAAAGHVFMAGVLLLTAACSGKLPSGLTAAASAATCTLGADTKKIVGCFYNDYCVETLLTGLNDTAEKSRHSCETGYRGQTPGKFIQGICPSDGLAGSCMYSAKSPQNAGESGPMSIVRTYGRAVPATVLKKDCESTQDEFTITTFCGP